MIYFFKTQNQSIIAVNAVKEFNQQTIDKLVWLFSDAEYLESDHLTGWYVGPRKEMITPWSTNAVEIAENMGVEGINRIEEYFIIDNDKASYDPMLQTKYYSLNSTIFEIDKKPDAIVEVKNIEAYNQKEGLALSEEEIEYLEGVSKELGRLLTDSEVYGFAQVNSEHCRHKIFNGTFIINGKEKESTLFQLIKKTSKQNPNKIVSAYKDNCSFVQGPVVEQFAPQTQNKPDFFEIKEIETVLSLKAETHNFPTTVEPFNGAATGTGGEIRDRMAGGRASFPVAGTAVYMTSYPRTEAERAWEQATDERPWLYQTPEEILIKASNGASDYGNKFGQPIIAGSVLTFEHFEPYRKYGYDKVIMLAGGIGFGNKRDSLKGTPKTKDRVVLLGGDNYRIGMGGGAVSSVATGEFESNIELNAVQRANPEMQKRVYNVIRALGESDNNPIVSIHDHGAGGHLNCLSELVEDTGGIIHTDKLPIGDSTLSQKEIIGNESQERMGLVVKPNQLVLLEEIAKRERAPIYNIGEVTGDMQFTFENSKTEEKPIDWQLKYMFGSSPKTILFDNTDQDTYNCLEYDVEALEVYLEDVLQLESVACKDWLTNKVDRSVTGKIAKQQCVGELQLPLNNVGVIALDYRGKAGFATSIGHAPVAGLIDAASGSVLSIAEALTNIIWAPLTDDIKSISLSANWMWPAKNAGENERIYNAVEAASNFACDLGINIPTGKDSMSMTQKYDDEVVYAPGTVIITASGEVEDVRKVVEPVVVNDESKELLFIDFSFMERSLGGSAFAQIINMIGCNAPTVKDTDKFVAAFNAVQHLIKNDLILAGHDVSSGGLATTLLEMCFPNKKGGVEINLNGFQEEDTVKILLSENPGIVIQCADNEKVKKYLTDNNIHFINLGKVIDNRKLHIVNGDRAYDFDIDTLRDVWYKSSYLLDRKQSGTTLALERFKNYKNIALSYDFKDFSGKAKDLGIDLSRREASGIKAAIIREKGVNGDREMAYALYLAGFDVKDVHMTDLISGRETLEDINMIVFVGGFSNSDVLGSAKGWAGAFKYNPKAKQALDKFYRRNDTLSLGVCNGCQLMVELNLIYPNHSIRPKMQHNESGKFESNFINVDILQNNAVMLQNMAGMKLGIWIAHGEGQFYLPFNEKEYNIPMKYAQDIYPANPNGSHYAAAAISSDDGRHLAMMPHLERSFAQWQWANYPANRTDEVSPWIQAFVNAREWIKKNK